MNRTPKRHKTTPKTVPRGPQSAQERPQTPPRRPQDPPKTTQDPPRSPLGTVLGPSWDHEATRSKSRPIFGKRPRDFVDFFGAQNDPQNDPKTTPKRVKNQDEKCITFLSLLDPSWTGLEAILGPSWGQKSGSRLTFSNVF